MKRFWTVLLSGVLVAAWCMPAAALDVKMKGSYIVMGIYEDNRSLVDDDDGGDGNQHSGASMAYYSQRLRLEPSFKITDGLTFSMRADAMTRVWGQTAIGAEANPKDEGWLDTRNYESEQNIQLKRGWVDFTTQLGQFQVGYMADGLWGTDFGDTSSEGPQIVYALKTGPVLLSATLEKLKEGRLGASGLNPGYTDSDQDKYWLSGTYFWQGGQTGLLVGHMRYADTRPTKNYQTAWNTYRWYFKTTLGAFYAEGEIEYDKGDYADYEKGYGEDIDHEAWQWFLMGRYTVGPVFIGVQYAHTSGDDYKTEDKREDIRAGGNVWQPTLIFWNDWIDRYSGNVGMYGKVRNTFTNADLYQIFAGYQPTTKISVKASFTMAWADKKPKDYSDDEYGKEFDLTAGYRIFDNLEYMVGFAYLWAGDYFKGTQSDAKIDNDYLVLHQLTLKF